MNKRIFAQAEFQIKLEKDSVHLLDLCHLALESSFIVVNAVIENATTNNDKLTITEIDENGVIIRNKNIEFEEELFFTLGYHTIIQNKEGGYLLYLHNSDDTGIDIGGIVLSLDEDFNITWKSYLKSTYHATSPHLLYEEENIRLFTLDWSDSRLGIWNILYTNNGAILSSKRLSGTLGLSLILHDVEKYNDNYYLLCSQSIDNTFSRNILLTLDSGGELLSSMAIPSKFSMSEIKIDHEGNFILLSSISGMYKYDPNFNFLWAKKLADTNYRYRGNGNSIYTDASNNIYVTGIQQENATLDGNVLIKLDPDGEVLFQKLMLDGVNRLSNDIQIIDNMFLLEIPTFDSNMVYRKVNYDFEASDCESLPTCLTFEDAQQLVFEDAEIMINEVDTQSGDTLSIQVYEDTSVYVTHVCEPISYPSAVFQLTKDQYCKNTVIEIQDSTIYEFGSSTFYFSENDSILNTKLPNAISSDQPGEYFIAHTLELLGCFYTDTVDYQVSLSSIENVIDLVTLCDDIPETISLNNESVEQVTWSNGDTSFITSIEETGTSYAIILDTVGCIDTIYFEVIENYTPSFDYEIDTTFCNGNSVTLHPPFDLLGEYDYQWSTGEMTKEIVVSAEEEFVLTIENECGEGEINYEVTAFDCGSIPIVPNIISHASDYPNNTFTIHWLHGDILDLKIFDRWGNLVLSIQNTNEINWQGSYNGQNVASGVYVVKIEYNLFNNNEIKTIYSDLTVIE